MKFSPNPAKRIFDLTNEALHEVHNRSLDKPAINVWAKIFELSIEDEFEIIKRLFDCQKLIDKVDKILRSNKITNNDLYLNCLPQIRKLFPIGKVYNSFWSIRQTVTSTHLKELEFCIHAID